MNDSVVRALLGLGNLKVSVAVLTHLAREARARHHLQSVSATLLAQGLLGGVLMASLQKGDTRINVQLECDGPFRGFLVDASADGTVRGYVKNPSVDVELARGEFQWRAALGNSGFISVLRDIGGEYYRSSVELVSMHLSEDLNHYFKTSDQVPTSVALTVQHGEAEALDRVAGVLVQALPDADLEVMSSLSATLESRLVETVASLSSQPLDASTLLKALFPEAQQLAQTPVRFACTCSKERAMDMLEALGVKEIQDIVDTQGSTAVTCHFCGTKHEIGLADLWVLLERLGRPQVKN